MGDEHGEPRDGWTAVVVYSAAPEAVGTALPIGDKVRFGRTTSAEVDVAIDDRKMSRRHATLARRGLAIEVVDEGSSNGTFLNGRRLTAGRGSALAAEDVVRMGDTLVVVAARAPGEPSPYPTLIGRSAPFLAALDLATRVAPAPLPVLLMGEAGTGKDVVARHIHARSGRPGPYLAVSCATLPSDLAEVTLFGQRKSATSDANGYLAQADGGTLFLDEIGELPLPLQARLLRLLETREYVPVGALAPLHADVRVIAATSVDLHDATASGAFRADVLSRLAGAMIRLPPLRSRRADVLDLAARYLGPAHSFSPHAAEALLLHPWPHNVRELRSAMQRVTLAQPDGAEVSRRTIDTVLDLPPATRATSGSTTSPARAPAPEREELVVRLTAHHGNVHRLAEEYGKDPKQIYRWLKKHGIDPDNYR